MRYRSARFANYLRVGIFEHVDADTCRSILLYPIRCFVYSASIFSGGLPRTLLSLMFLTDATCSYLCISAVFRAAIDADGRYALPQTVCVITSTRNIIRADISRTADVACGISLNSTVCLNDRTAA